jgi:hypothetical protein
MSIRNELILCWRLHDGSVIAPGTKIEMHYNYEGIDMVFKGYVCYLNQDSIAIDVRKNDSILIFKSDITYIKKVN